jgi:hypothetical protein
MSIYLKIRDLERLSYVEKSKSFIQVEGVSSTMLPSGSFSPGTDLSDV